MPALLESPHLEMVKQTPSPVTSPSLHLQGKPCTPHFQDVGRRRRRRATPSTLLLRRPINSNQMAKSSGGDRVVINLSSLNLRIACGLPYLQNANSSQNPELRPLRSSLHLHRSLRCVPPYPYPPPIPEIPGVHPRGQAVFLPSNAIRDQYRPKNILLGGHRGPETPPQKKEFRPRCTSTIDCSGASLIAPSPQTLHRRWSSLKNWASP